MPLNAVFFVPADWVGQGVQPWTCSASIQGVRSAPGRLCDGQLLEAHRRDSRAQKKPLGGFCWRLGSLKHFNCEA